MKRENIENEKRQKVENLQQMKMKNKRARGVISLCYKLCSLSAHYAKCNVSFAAGVLVAFLAF